MLPIRLVSSKLGVINLSLYVVCTQSLSHYFVGIHLLLFYSLSSYFPFHLDPIFNYESREYVGRCHVPPLYLSSILRFVDVYHQTQF